MAQSKRATNGDGLMEMVQTDSSKRPLLVESDRYRGVIKVEELKESGATSVVIYDTDFEILTEHGLQLLVADMGMTPALDLLQKNADRRNEVSVVETPKELLGAVTDCVACLVRPNSWQRDKLIHWVEKHGPYLMHYFGEGIDLAVTPEYEIRSLSLVHAA